MKKITAIIALVILLASCATTKPSHPEATGIYTIATIDTGDVVTFKEVRGKYLILSDTIKVGDKIILNVIKIHR